LGVDDEMQRLVALKVLPISMIGHGDMLERFRREENAVLHLEHPGIVPVFDVGQHEGVPFFVMRYVNGMRFDVHLRSLWHRAGLEPTAAQPSDQTVTHLAGKHPTGTSASLSVDGSAYFDETHPTGEVLHIVEQVARALHHAHDHGVIHRDVKPSNVMIDGDGNPQLMDFGLAKLASDATITQTGRLMGTVPYMSPEQVATQRIGIDHRTDIYSLGVMLFESLTGRRPFTAKNAEELMFDIIMKAPPSPLTVNPHLTKDMETVVLKCLEKNPEHRFQSAHELAEELARLRAHQQIESEPVGRLARAFRWAARHRALSGLILSLVLASLLLIGILVHGAWTDRRERERFANHQAESARTSIAALSSIEERLAAAVDQQHRLSMLPAQSSEDLAAMERLRTEIGAAESDRDQLQRSIDRYYSRAIAAGLDVRDERDGHRLRWWRDAKRRGDLVIADSLEAELRRGRLGDQLRWVGKLSLSTEPAGLPVRALRLVDQPDGRRTVDQGQALDLGTTPVSAKELEAGSWLLRIETPDGFILDYPVYLEVDAHWGDSSFANGRFADRDWTLRIADYQAVSADGLRPVPAGPYLASEPRVQRIREPVMTWRWEEGFGIAADEASFADWFAFLSAVRKDGKVGLAR
ncbi:MAG: serine/threonine protein kinase, partial [Planctomycetes bacterium]|nr:serine/threonine protein kinase [Planctomycetota bacterium]